MHRRKSTPWTAYCRESLVGSAGHVRAAILTVFLVTRCSTLTEGVGGDGTIILDLSCNDSLLDLSELTWGVATRNLTGKGRDTRDDFTHEVASGRASQAVTAMEQLPTWPFLLVPSSKDSSPTLASKVDQLEGMLKMLREDLKKVTRFSKQNAQGMQ